MGSGGTVCSAHQTEMGGVSKGLQTAKCSAHTELPGPGGSVGGGVGWGRDCLVANTHGQGGDLGPWSLAKAVACRCVQATLGRRHGFPGAACRPPWARGMGSLGLGGNRNPDLSPLPGLRCGGCETPFPACECQKEHPPVMLLGRPGCGPWGCGRGQESLGGWRPSLPASNPDGLGVSSPRVPV